jgi:CRP-like cAMP-binding protein
MAILNGRPRSATAVVRVDSRLLVIEGKTFEAMMRARPEIALRIIKALATRLASANQHIELLLLPTPNHRVVQCLRHMADEQISLAGQSVTHGSAILVPKRIEDVATRVGLPIHEVIEVLDRLRAARLVLMAEDAGIEGDGFIVPEVGRLLEFLEFLNLKDRFGA